MSIRTLVTFARMEQALLFRGRSVLGWSRRDVGVPGVANIKPLSAPLHGDGEIVPGIDDLPRLVLHHVGPGLPTHVTGNAPGGVGAETGRDTGLLRLRGVLRKEAANRRSAIRGWCARQQQHCMFIVETRRILTQFYFPEFRPKEFFNRHACSQQPSRTCPPRDAKKSRPDIGAARVFVRDWEILFQVF